MSSEFTSAYDFVQTHPGLAVLRMAALLAESAAAPDRESLDLMFEQAKTGALADTDPADIWPELARGMMGPAPDKMLLTLRASGALPLILPELSALFGVPQITDGLSEVDLGEHTLKSLAVAARVNAPLPVRFALLVMHAGKYDSPREHWPIHYKHIERGHPRIEAIATRFGVGAECVDLALLALAECEKVHRVSKVRAGPVALMLVRLGAFNAPSRFHQLMTVCACDFNAHADRAGQTYEKAALLDIALAACAGADTDDARAEAIARAFRSQRWSDDG